MEQYISISQINDFLYSPASLYMHTAYYDYTSDVFKAREQINGTIKHENIDKGKYSSRKNIISGKMVYSHEYGLVGKIDIFDTKTGLLVERKAKIKRVYKGYRFQLYAQMFALEEMGYDVCTLALHSLEDNKRYTVDWPSTLEKEEFFKTIRRMRDFSVEDLLNEHTDYRGDISIYSGLAW